MPRVLILSPRTIRQVQCGYEPRDFRWSGHGLFRWCSAPEERYRVARTRCRHSLYARRFARPWYPRREPRLFLWIVLSCDLSYGERRNAYNHFQKRSGRVRLAACEHWLTGLCRLQNGQSTVNEE